MSRDASVSERVVQVEYDRNDKRWDKLDKILKMFQDTEVTETEEA